MGAHPLFSTLSRRGLNPIKLAYSPSPPDNGLGQYVSSPGNRAYCYAEVAVSSLAMAVIITSTHFAYPRRDGQADLAWVKGNEGELKRMEGEEKERRGGRRGGRENESVRVRKSQVVEGRGEVVSHL